MAPRQRRRPSSDVGRHEAQPAPGALGQGEADPADVGKAEEVGEDAAGDGVDVAGVVEHELQAVDVLGLGPRVIASDCPRSGPTVAHEAKWCHDAQFAWRQNFPGRDGPECAGESDGQAGGAEAEAHGSGPPCFLLALGVTFCMVAWGYLVKAAIDFGSTARGGDQDAWMFLGVRVARRGGLPVRRADAGRADPAPARASPTRVVGCRRPDVGHEPRAAGRSRSGRSAGTGAH